MPKNYRSTGSLNEDNYQFKTVSDIELIKMKYNGDEEKSPPTKKGVSKLKVDKGILEKRHEKTNNGKMKDIMQEKKSTLNKEKKLQTVWISLTEK